MSRTLVVVESPGKIAKIKSILGPNYEVKASYGHILDLAHNCMSIDFNNNFEPIYADNADPRKKKCIAELRKAYRECTDVLIASDKDREGEMIAWSIAHVLKLKNPKRIVFGSITKTEIKKAVSNPGTIDMLKVESQKARRVLDRLVGYTLSPLAGKYFHTTGISAGRVQSVVVRLIVEREEKIAEFIKGAKGSYYITRADFEHINGELCGMILHDFKDINDEGFWKGPVTHWKSEEQVMQFMEYCRTTRFRVHAIYEKESMGCPSPPFTTSTLQQDASTRLHFNVKRTMETAQRLYEKGYITYMRTDSVNIATEGLDAIQRYICEHHGLSYYRRVAYKSKGENTQEAHECVRPTVIDRVPTHEDIDTLDPDQSRLYGLIWCRTVASQMQPARYETTHVHVEIIGDHDHFFAASYKRTLFPGYRVVYEDDDVDEELPVFPEIGSFVERKKIVSTQDFDKPPLRFNEAALIKKLDPEKGMNIGRPATYQSLIAKILDRQYVEIKNVTGEKRDSAIITLQDDNIDRTVKQISIGNENKKFVPTDLGTRLTHFLLEHFPDVMDYQFTSNMENQLDDIAHGKYVWHQVLREFYDLFEPTVREIEGAIKHTPKEQNIIGHHPDSGDPIELVITRHGPAIKMGKKYVSVSSADAVTLEQAVELLRYPKVLGQHNGIDVLVKKGPHGLYLSYSCLACDLDEDDGNTSLSDAILRLEVIKREKRIIHLLDTDTHVYSVRDGARGTYIMITDKAKKQSKPKFISVPPDMVIDQLTLDTVEEVQQKHKDEQKHFNQLVKKASLKGRNKKKFPPKKK